MDGKERSRLVLQLIVMIGAALVVVVSLVGVMYYANYDSSRAVPIAQQRDDQ